MKIYKVKITDKSLYEEEAPRQYDGLIAVGMAHELEDYNRYLPPNYTDDDIHYYFGEGEHDFSVGNKVETDEFIYQIVEEQV